MRMNDNMTTQYIVGCQSGRGMINIGTDHIGKRFSRAVWQDGRIVFTPIIKAIDITETSTRD